MNNTNIHKEVIELDDFISSIKEMQNKVLDVFTPNCKKCIKILKDLNLLKEEACLLSDTLKKNL